MNFIRPKLGRVRIRFFSNPSNPGQIHPDPQLWRQKQFFFHGQEVKGTGQQICHEILIFILAIIELVIYRGVISCPLLLAVVVEWVLNIKGALFFLIFISALLISKFLLAIIELLIYREVISCPLSLAVEWVLNIKGERFFLLIFKSALLIYLFMLAIIESVIYREVLRLSKYIQSSCIYVWTQSFVEPALCFEGENTDKWVVVLRLEFMSRGLNWLHEIEIKATSPRFILLFTEIHI